jgi:hypothetical protein
MGSEALSPADRIDNEGDGAGAADAVTRQP